MKTKLFIFLSIFSGLLLAQTPVFHFNFDGNLTDASTNEYTLTTQGLFSPNYVNDKDGNANSAIDFPGASGDFLLSDYNGISASAARTVAVWARTTSISTSQRHSIVSWGTNTSELMFNVMILDGAIRVEGGNSNIMSETGLLNDGDWHHIAVTFAGSPTATMLNECKLYIDGTEVPIATNFNGTRLINTAVDNPVRIGQAIYSTTHFFGNGALDDLRIYDSELTAGEVLTVSGLSASPPPVANFSVSNATPSQDEIISFTNLSTNTPTSYTWDFGASDALGDISAQNPQVSYPTPGTYTVTLTVSNTGGSDSETKADYIVVAAGSGSGSLQAQYNFDGNTNDGSSYGRDLIATETFLPTYGTDSDLNVSSALVTSGIYSNHLITGYPGIGGDGARSVTAWFKTTGTGRETIVSYGKDNGGKMFNVMIDAGVPRLEAGSSSLITADISLNDDVWHHIVVTYDPLDGAKLSQCKIYIDGVLSTNTVDGSGSFQSDIVSIDTDVLTNFLKIGSAIYGSHTFHGLIDDVRIYNRAISEAEVVLVKNRATLSTATTKLKQDIKAYPTVVDHALNINVASAATMEVRLYNLYGSLVKFQTFNNHGGHFSLDMGTVKSGVYLAKVMSEGAAVGTIKVVKR
ncbi:LamG-like jellyroll fold domain-containing protein [Snuella lapsa]|uniref:PKD domain-containing protein n=1 Tax=Snuella lapsa TaxID=870481 RepID=A0ABP6XKJ1_9FLAO